MANIITTRSRSDFSTNREKLDFAEGIALLDPNENPMTLMSMKMGKKSSGNIKHSWLYDELVPETDTINGGASAASTAITVDNPTYFSAGDIIKFNATNETALVTAAPSTGVLTVIRDYGATSGAYTPLAAEVADGEYLTIIGNAFEAGHILPISKSTLEIQMDNWCQTQRTPFGITEVAAAAAVRGEADWPWQMKKAGISHQRKLEYQHLWGHPMPGDGSLNTGIAANTAPATGGGLMHYLTGGTGFTGTGSDRVISQAELTQAEFLAALEPMFEYGSAQKVMFCAPIFRTALDFWGISKLNTFTEGTAFGMNVAKWVSAHGTIVFVTHKMLKDPGSDGATAFIVDMDDINIVTYSDIGSTRLKSLEPYKATGATIKQAEYQTISCLELRTPKKHGVIKDVTSYAA